jgi:hypothetical protein
MLLKAVAAKVSAASDYAKMQRGALEIEFTLASGSGHAGACR